MRRVLAALIVGVFASVALGAATAGGATTPGAYAEGRPSVRLADLDSHAVDPFAAAEDAKAIVFLFASVECPISNRYAPVVKRLVETYGSQGVAFWMIYPNPSDSPAAIREHLKAFNYPVHALRDPNHELVKMAQAVVTPEAAVFDKTGTLAYHGRIDDRYISIGVERPSATTHDLADALAAMMAGRTPKAAAGPAVGCFISDFVS